MNLEEMKHICSIASESPWSCGEFDDEWDGSFQIITQNKDQIGKSWICARTQHRSDADFISTFDPLVVISMINVIEAAYRATKHNTDKKNQILREQFERLFPSMVKLEKSLNEFEKIMNLKISL